MLHFVRHRGGLVVPPNGNYIKASWVLEQFPALKKLQGETRQALLFGAVNAISRMSRQFRGQCLYLDEDDGRQAIWSLVDCDDIDLTATVAVVRSDDLHPFAAKKDRRSLFATFTDGGTRIDSAVPPSSEPISDRASSDPISDRVGCEPVSDRADRKFGSIEKSVSVKIAHSGSPLGR